VADERGAVRERAHLILALAEADGLAHFAYRPALLPATVDYVLATIRAIIPISPFPSTAAGATSAWGGRDRWGLLAGDLAGALPRGDRADPVRISR